MQRSLIAATTLVMLATVSGSAQGPSYRVVPLWPQPLPNHWVLGSTIGVSVDAQDHVWIIHRPQSIDDNFKAADEVDCIVRKQATLRRRNGDREIGDNTIGISVARIAIEAGRLIDRKDERVMLSA